MFCSSFESTKLLPTFRPWMSDREQKAANDGQRAGRVAVWSIPNGDVRSPATVSSMIASGHGWASESSAVRTVIVDREHAQLPIRLDVREAPTAKTRQSPHADVRALLIACLPGVRR